jgi:hypothetical protein
MSEKLEVGPFPMNAVVRGALYPDPAHDYELGDVLHVELPNGFEIDVTTNPRGRLPFKVTVYFRLAGHAIAEPFAQWFCCSPGHVVTSLGMLAIDLMKYRPVLEDP